MPNIHERVRRGAAWLDACPEAPPDWRDEINTRTLDLVDGRMCVIAQVFGGWDRAADKFWPGWDDNFDLSDTWDKFISKLGFADFDGVFTSKELTEAWREYLAEDFVRRPRPSTETMTPRTYDQDGVSFYHDGNNTGFVGDFVRMQGKTGRIYGAHFGCPEDDDWLSIQQLLGSNPMRWKKCRWVSILVHGGGAAAVPEQFVEVIEPFELDNNNRKMYFRD